MSAFPPIVICTLLLVEIPANGSMADAPVVIRDREAAYGPASPGEKDAAWRQGGETLADALPIGGLPFHDTGTTLGYADDYSEPCEYPGTGAPDVVYAFSPSSDQFIRIATCGSSFDTKLYVYEDDVDNLVFCNDTGGECSMIWEYVLAYISTLPVHAGHTYYIVLDGSYSMDKGPYVIDVTERFPPEACEAICPPEGTQEGEPDCYDGYVDVFNGGCTSTPPVFSTLTCNGDLLRMCGRSGEFDDGASEDQDWYEFVLSEPRDLMIRACANIGIGVHLIRPEPDCSAPTLLAYGWVRAYETATLSMSLSPGRYWYFVKSYGGFLSACGEAAYVFEVAGLCPTPTGTEGLSWGRVKQLFR